MRSFIGLDLSLQEKLALSGWRERALPAVVLRKTGAIVAPGQKAPPAAVPPENYHLTLAFLGDINQRQHESLLHALDDIAAEPFSVTLNTTGVWDGPKILYAGPDEPCPPLMQLAKCVRKAAREAGIPLENREYKPHVTVVRKAGSDQPAPLLPPDIKLQFCDFHFFESVSTPSGVRYPVRHSWSLEPDISVRERLRRGLV